MDIVTSIGWLAIAAIAIFAFFHFLDQKELSDSERRQLITNSDKCQEAIRNHNNAVGEGRPVLSNAEFQKKLTKILEDPEEKSRAIAKIQKKKQEKEKLELDNRNRRKVGYTYEKAIFEIFDCDRELSQDILLKKIQIKFDTTESHAKKLLQIWDDNHLVNNYYWNKELWEVGYILTSGSCKIDHTDLTREDWLQQNGKTLKPQNL